jgi:hypothetical protein
MDEPPDPPDGGTDEALLEIAAHELEEQAAPLNQITQKKRSGNSPGHNKTEQYQFFQ